MRNILLILCVFFSVCDVFGQNEYVGNSDEMENFDRPCPVYDIRCIRKFFAKHGKCSIATGPAPDPYFRSQVPFDVPQANLSVSVNDQKVQGLNGRIEEFYVNKDTGNVVIAIDLSLMLSSNNTFFIIQRRAKEPVVTVGFAEVAFQSVVMTAVIPKIDNIRLDLAEVTTFANTGTPQFAVGPSLFATSDPTAQVALAEFIGRLPQTIQEMFLLEASKFASLYIQYNICDFGLKVY